MTKNDTTSKKNMVVGMLIFLATFKALTVIGILFITSGAIFLSAFLQL